MKKDLKKDQLIKKAMDALEKQAIQDEEAKKLRGGFDILDHTTMGMWVP